MNESYEGIAMVITRTTSRNSATTRTSPSAGVSRIGLKSWLSGLSVTSSTAPVAALLVTLHRFSVYRPVSGS